jgi:hypothetical protein
MLRYSPVKGVFPRVTWILLGVCFVLLYSCPVKKFLILHFAKTHPAQGTEAEFIKAHSAADVRIAYLHKDTSVYTVPSTRRSFRPVDPSSFPFRPFLYSLAGEENLLQANGHLLAENRTTVYGPLRYLQLLRLRI